QKMYPVTEVIKAALSFYQASGGWAPLVEVKTTEEMRKALRARGGTHANWAIRAPEAVQLPEASLPVHPYLLGAWLGDGASRTGAITMGARDAAEQFPRLSEMWDGPIATSDGKGSVTLRFQRDDD